MLIIIHRPAPGPLAPPPSASGRPQADSTPCKGGVQMGNRRGPKSLMRTEHGALLIQPAIRWSRREASHMERTGSWLPMAVLPLRLHSPLLRKSTSELASRPASLWSCQAG